jgi:succinylglutamic semialdehyde dehydrogenase
MSFRKVFAMLTVKVLGDYLNGRFRRPRGSESKVVSRDPGDSGYRIGAFPVYPDHVDAAIKAAQNAFDGWRARGLSERADVLRKFAAEVINRRDELRNLIAAESGKPLWEAELDVVSIEAQVETELREGVRAVSPFKVGEIRWGVHGACRHEPLGVTAVLGPAASPVDLPCALILPALLAGNTVVFKPSKLVPACGQFIARLFHEVELPAGVFNLIQGDATSGLSLVADPRVDAVLFAGASPSGARILEATAAQPHKMVALQMGGVNPLVVLDDADLERAVYEAVKGCMLTAGQRYTSTGVILIERGIGKDFVEAFTETVAALKVGYALDDDVFLGPLLSQAARERARDRQAQLVGQGAHRLIEAKPLEGARPGYYLSPGVLMLDKPLPLAELRPDGQSFGPDVVLMPFAKESEGIALANSSAYRLAAAVVTEDEKRFGRWAGQLSYGLINHNLSTTDVTMRLPLVGQAQSANHRPYGVYTQRTCTSPVSSLRAPQKYDPGRNLPNYPKR